jgi:protein-disulfide isomerase
MPIPESQAATHAAGPRASALPFVGAALLLVAAGASGILVADHLGWMAPPGCGAKSPCRAAVSSAWGKVPGLGWPVSFVGFSYFLGALAAWVASGGSPAPAIRWITRLGAAASLLFIGVMLVDNLLCPYCLTSHAANLAFVGVAEVAARRGRAPLARGLAALVAVFGVVSAALGFAETRAKEKVENEFEASMQEMLRESKAKTAAQVPAATGQTGATGSTATPPAAAPPSPPIVLPAIFTGRYRWGPEVAPIRIVMFTGYQCPDCKKIDPQIRELIDTRKDVSVSIKHFPFCSDCNPHVPKTMHANACWAARAAEAAGILKGSDGFRKMHDWLFARSGAFTATDLNAALLQFGWDAAAFTQTMQGPTTLRNVQTDAEEAVAYGLRFSPMIFINGMELKVWNADNAVKRAVEQLAATNPPAQGPEQDRPVKAGDKYVADWRDQPAMAWPTRANLPALGVPNAKVKITLFGDLLEPNTAEADKIIRDAMAGRNDMWYEFRYFPVDRTCNPGVEQTMFPQACRAARAAEAANALGGREAYWKVHEWIQANASTFNDVTLRAIAPSLGLNADELLKKMDDSELGKLVDFDNNIGMRLQIKEIPRIAVNGKHVPRWKLKDQFVLERIIDEAGTEQPK